MILEDSLIPEYWTSNMTMISVSYHPLLVGLKFKDLQVTVMSLSLQGLWSWCVWPSKLSVWWMPPHYTLWHRSWMSASHKSGDLLSAFFHPKKTSKNSINYIGSSEGQKQKERRCYENPDRVKYKKRKIGKKHFDFIVCALENKFKCL